MKTTIKKIIKGTLAILAIKLLVVLGIFIFQSCQNEDPSIERKNEAASEFKSALEDSKSRLSQIKIIHRNRPEKSNEYDIFSRYYGDETDSICFKDYDHTTSESINAIVDDINNVDDLIDAKNYHELIIAGINDDPNDDDTDNSDSTASEQEMENCLATIEIPIQPVADALLPAIEASKNYLYSVGYTEQELIDMINEENGQEEDLVPLVYLMTSFENSRNQTTAFNSMNLFVSSAYAQSGLSNLEWEDFLECAAIAIGANLIWSIGSESPNWKKKSIKKAFGKIASRFLGPLGVAIAVGTFSYCVVRKAYLSDT